MGRLISFIADAVSPFSCSQTAIFILPAAFLPMSVSLLVLAKPLRFLLNYFHNAG